MQGLHEARNGGTVGWQIARRSKMTFDIFGHGKNVVNDCLTWNQNRVTCGRISGFIFVGRICFFLFDCFYGWKLETCQKSSSE